MTNGFCQDTMQFLPKTSGFVLSVLLWSNIALAVAINNPSTFISLVQDSDNGQLGVGSGSGVPPEFQASRIQPRGEAIDDRSTLYTAVRILSDLARRDYTEYIRPEGWSWRGVTIAITLYGTRPGTRGIQVRCVVWGIFAAAEDMIASRDFRGALYELKWSGQAVGVVGVYKTQQLDASSNLAFQGMTRTLFQGIPRLNDTLSMSTPSSANNVSVPLSARGDLEVLFLRLDSPEREPEEMHPWSIYRNILALLVFSAQHKSSDAIIRNFQTSAAGSQVEIFVDGPDTAKPLTTPPYFHWDELCRAMKVTSDILMSTRYFKEFKVQLKIDGIDIGNISVQPKTATSVAAAGLSIRTDRQGKSMTQI